MTRGYSVLTATNGRLLSSCSVQQTIVLSFYSPNILLPITLNITPFAYLTKDSHAPPKSGALAGLNRPSIPALASVPFIFDSFNQSNDFCNSLAAAMKFVALSEIIDCGFPQRAMTRWTASGKNSLSFDPTTSRFNARTHKQVNKHIHLFSVFVNNFTTNGPNNPY